MARFLVELMINASGEPEVRAVFDSIGASAGRSSKAVDQASLRTEASLRRTAEAAAKLRTQMSETGKSKSFISDMDALNKKLKEQADHWKKGEIGIAAWAEKEKAAAEAQRILNAQVRAGVSAESEHGKKIADLIRQHNIYQKELDETKRKEAERIAKKLNTTGDPALASVLGALGPVGGQAVGSAQQILYLKGAVDTLKESGKGAAQALTQILAGLGPMGGIALGAAAGLFVLKQAWDVTFGAALSYLKDVVIEGTETQVMIEQLNSTLRSNGSYSGLSARGMIELSESLALLSGGMDDPIIKAETIISRFDKIGEDTFPRVVKAAVNMSRALGKSMEEAATSIARALSGTQGLRGLREAGITIDPAQKKYLENLLETNRLTEYQNTLLDILEQKLGNAAEAFGNTLPGAVGRANFVYGEFREEIANQVIPALEDVLSTLIEGAGGWDLILHVATESGAAIGDAVRKMVYAIAISYHEWQAATAGLAASILGVFKSIVEGISDFAGVMADVPGPQSTAFRAAQAETAKAAASLAKSQSDARKSALDHAGAVINLTRGLVQHRTALDGDTKAYVAHGVEIDKVNKKNADQERLGKQLAQIQQEQMERARYLMELDKLARTRGLNEGERIAIEARINREHEYRVDLLKKQAQFGQQIGKALADQERALKDWERNVKLELEIAFIPKISMDKVVKDEFDRFWQGFTKWAKEARTLAEDNAAAYAAVEIAHDKWLQDFTDSWRESWKTTRERFEDEMQAIRDAVALGSDAGGMSAAEGERALAQVRSEMLANHLDEWGAFFNTLGGMFGGLFQKISSAINNIQAAQGAGNQLGSMIGSASGSGAAWGQALGYMGATIQIFYEIYKAVDGHLKREKARTYRESTSVEIQGGKWSSPSYFTEAGREMSIALRRMLQDIVDSLGAVVNDLPKIVIRARNDGKYFNAYVAGILVGTFRDAQSAMEAAVSEAIKQSDFSAISKEFAVVLKASVGATLDELERNIETARTARRARLGDTGEQYVDLSDQWRQEIDAAQKLGLAIGDMVDARRHELDALKYATLGIDTTVSDQLRALGSLNKGIAEASTSTRAALQQQIDAILAEIDRLTKPQGPQVGGGGRGDGGGSTTPSSRWRKGNSGRGYDESSAESEEVERLRREIELLVAELEKIPEALSPEELRMGIFDALYKPFEGTQNKYSEEAKKWARMRVEIEYELVRLELIRLGMWEEYQQMFNDSLAKARELAGQKVAGGGGRRSGEKQEVKDFIKERRFELGMSGLTEFEKQMKELGREYDEQAAKVGKNKTLLKDLNELRAQEIALLEEEQRKKVTKTVDEFLGLITPFDKVRETASGLIEEIEGSPFGNEDKAAMIGRIMGEVDRQLHELSQRTAVSLFREMLADMEAAGATEAQMSEARRQMAIIEHTLKMAHYAAEIEILRLKGDLTAEEMAALQAAFDYLKTIDPTKLPTPATPAADTTSVYKSAASSGIDIFADFEQAKARILEQLDEWNLSPLGELTKKASEMTLTFKKLMEDVVKLKPLGWDYTGLANEAFAKAKAAFISGIFDSIEAEVEGSPLVSRIKEINTQFEDIAAALVQIGAAQSDIERAELLRLKTIEKAMDDWLKPINALLDENKFGSLSTLTGEQQYKAAEAEFQKLTQGFLGGDLSISSEEIAKAAERFRELGREFTAGEGYRFIDKQITDTLLAIKASLPGLTGTGAATTSAGASGLTVSLPANVLTFLGGGTGSAAGMVAESSAATVSAITGTTAAINTGNTLMLSELRLVNTELRRQTGRLEQIDRGITELGFTTRNIA